MKIAVIGCGAMGSVYAGLLGSAGNEVWAVDVWQDHVDAIRRNGLRVEGKSGDRTVRINATTDPDEVGACPLIIIATKADGVAAAARVAKRLIAPDGVIVTIQNGLGAGERIAESIDTSQVVLGTAEERVQQHQPAEVVAHGELIGHADATMHLDAFVAHQKENLSQLRFRCACQLCDICRTGSGIMQRRERRSY